MIRRHLMALRLGLMVADGVSATVVFVLVSIVRFSDGDGLDVWNRLGIDLRLASISFGIGGVLTIDPKIGLAAYTHRTGSIRTCASPASAGPVRGLDAR